MKSPAHTVSFVALCMSLALFAGISASRAADADQRNREFQKAEALYLSGRLQESSTAFAELTRKYPGDARVWLKYGNTLTKQMSFDEAAKAFETAIRLDATQGAAALNLALVRLAQAQASLEVAVARLAPEAPEHAQAEGIRSQLNTLLGDSH